MGEDAAQLALACAGTLSFDPARSPLGFSGHHGDLDTVHQHIQFRNVLFQNHGQDDLFDAVDFLLISLGDLRANGLSGAFDGFGGYVQTCQQFHRLAPRSEWHLTAHHRFHAPHARRRFQTGDAQFAVSRALPCRAIGAEVVRTA